MTLKDINNKSFITFKKLGLFGKLGNQLFQIAAAAAYAEEHNIECILPIWKNIWTENTDMTHIFKGPFNINASIINANVENFKESSMVYSKIPQKTKINIEGYFQSEKYFLNNSNYIRKIFSFNEKIKEDVIVRNIGTFEKSCAIHVRRTDYLKYPNIHPCLDIEYYRKAIQYMKSFGYNKFLIFSDDLDWCKNNFNGKEYAFSDKNTKNYEDFILMSLCSSYIIANSTFSWWVAWLNADTEKKIVAPKIWFGLNGPQKHNIIPDKWMQL